jgi:hypothetical protein
MSRRGFIHYGRYSVGYTQGRSDRANRYLVGSDFNELTEAVEAATILGTVPRLGYGFVQDNENYRHGRAKIVHHTGQPNT